MSISRRGFLGAALSIAAGAALPSIAVASPTPASWIVKALNKTRTLTITRPDSKERITLTYWTPSGGWDLDGYRKACWLLRDVNGGNKVVQMDTGLLDTLFIMQSWLAAYGYNHDIYVLSGYRTPEHNASLEGAAKNSMHLYGRAADIYMPGVPPLLLSRMGQMLGLGGVGLYEKRGFIHVDSGSVRAWRG